MAKYQQYAEYKDSGYFHLGEIPKDWKILKLKHLTRCLDGQRIPLNAIERGEKKGNIPYWGANKIVDYVDDWIFYEQLILLGEDGAPFFDPNKDVAFLVNGKIWPNNHVHVLRPFKKLVNPTFLTYAINCTDFSLYISGSTRDKLNQSDMDNICIRFCSQAEQTQIANFLDHETAKIDSLIDKQEQLIELLKEKRQAVISHAVTKGLDPNVPMKDSGVEWLGQVPEHWISSRLKYYTNQIVDGAHFTPTYSESGIPFLRVTDIHNAAIDMENIKYIPEHEHFDLIQRCKPEKGDLLLSKNGTIGVPKLIDWEWKFSIFVSLCLIKFKKNLKAEFAEYFFKSYEIQEQIFGLIKKSTVINLHLDKIQNFWFSIPSVDEQIEIVNFLNHKTNELDNLISKAELAIQLMQERRTALISAAVTGKIDVRNWQNPTEARTEFSA